MNFIEAIIKIKENKNFSLCENELQQTGEQPSICVYRKGLFIGKLRWPNIEKGISASVDEELVEALLREDL